MKLDRRSFVGLISGALIILLVWQIRDVHITGALLRLEPIDLNTSGVRWGTGEGCETSTLVANAVGDTLMLCSSATADHIIAQWQQLSAWNADEVVISTDDFRTAQNVTVHEYTFKSTPPTKYFSTEQEAGTERVLHIHFLGTFTTDGENRKQWQFNAKGVQFSTDGSTLAYAYEFKKEQQGRISIMNQAGRNAVRLDLDIP